MLLESTQAAAGEFLRIGKYVTLWSISSAGVLRSVRVGARVGTDGKLARGAGAGAGAAGTWKDLTDNVNSMAANLTGRCATSRR